MNKLIINFTPTGVIPTKKSNFNVPISPDEICVDVKNAYDKGVQMVHLHAKNDDGLNTSDPNVFKIIIGKIREQCPKIIICVSLSGRIMNTFESRSSVLDLKGIYKPDMGSLTLSSLNFSRQESINSPDMIIKLLTKMNENKIKPELEVFDVGMINFAKYLIKKELLKPSYYFNLLFGNLCSAQAELEEIAYMTKILPQNSIYSYAGIGKAQKKLCMLGIMEAYGCRVGLEDNIYKFSESDELATNDDLISSVINMAKIYNRDLMHVDDVRNLLCLNSLNETM
jgi:3-keto-5-aminohexanoate cleavage enzyme